MVRGILMSCIWRLLSRPPFYHIAVSDVSDPIQGELSKCPAEDGVTAPGQTLTRAYATASGLLSPVALSPLRNKLRYCAIGQASPSIWSTKPQSRRVQGTGVDAALQ